MTVIARLLRVLRSRVLAAWLLFALTAYLTLAAVLPRFSAFYTNAAFDAAALLLALATAACAWERTRVAVRSAMRAAPGGPATPLALASGADPAAAEQAATAALRRLGMRERRGRWADGAAAPRVFARTRLALTGSPAFHLALVALFLVIGGGQLVRFEGTLLLYSGRPVVDDAGAYSEARAGALFGNGYTHARFTLLEATPDHVVDGVDRGAASRMRVEPPRGEAYERWVYPNAPLRLGALTLHSRESGPAVSLTLTSADGASEITATVPLTVATDGQRVGVLDVTRPGTTALAVRLTQAPGRRLAVSSAEGSGTPDTVTAGESATLPGGTRLRIDSLDTWSTLNAASDPLDPLLGWLLGVGCVGAALAVLYPYRAVSVTAAEKPGALTLRVEARRIDPAFRARALSAVRAALEAEGLLGEEAATPEA